MSKRLLSLVLRIGLCAGLSLALAAPSSAIPAFARKYGLRCTTCHESWPVLNDFGRNFRDNGYQMRLGKDDVVTAEPAYWPVSVHITPSYEYTRVTNQQTDQGNKTLSSGGVADAAIDLLMAGVLTNISAQSGTSNIACSQTIRRAGNSCREAKATMNVSK